MLVLRGHAGGPDADDAVTERMLSRAADDRQPVLRVWRPERCCSFGRRDVRAEEYPRARSAALERGFTPVERRTGGRAVVYTGTTVAVARAEPIDDIRDGFVERYDAMATGVQQALWRLDVPAQRGEPADSFCPGRPSLQWEGKVAGFAQRVQRRVALVGGVVLVDGHDEIADVLELVYDALDVPFDPASVGSVDRAGGRTDAETAVRTIEEALLGGATPDVERVDRDG